MLIFRYLDLLKADGCVSGGGNNAQKVEVVFLSNLSLLIMFCNTNMSLSVCQPSRLASLMDHAAELRADKEVGPHLQKMTAMLIGEISTTTMTVIITTY